MDLAEKFLKQASDLSKLSQDVDIAKKRIALADKEDAESKAAMENLSYKSTLPMTVLRKDEAEVVDALENPDLYHIIDKVKQIVNK